MFHDAFAHLEGQIQSGEIAGTLLENAPTIRGVRVVIKGCAKRVHQLVRVSFAGMSKRRMANVVNQRESFGERS